MTELVFLSTNRIKLAHFKYIGRKCGVRIAGFREKSFFASYDEPMIDDRKELLSESYKNALIQWERTSVGKKDSGYFFFEDTSVRIEALSADRETPGVNIKYWMKGMTFKKLDALLKASGNDRRVTVRSDLILHIPKKQRDAMGFKESFLWVWGETSGKISDRNRTITSNLVYPWLDNKSFNKWFVPDGFDKPLSALNIRDADTADFRAKAFAKILELLKHLGILANPSLLDQTQLTFPSISNFPSIFLICGASCAGKTTVASWLRDRKQFMHLEASDFMHKAFWERHGLGSTIHIGDFAEAALKTEPAIVSSQLADLIFTRQYPAVVITGFRSPDEFQILQAALAPHRSIELIYLDSNESVRLDRAILRGRDNVSAEKFHKRNLQEIRMGLPKIGALADCKHINNDKTLSILYRTFTKIYQPVFEVLKQASLKKPGVYDGELEALILRTLLRENDKNIWLTTTEIAYLLNKFFEQKKSKNNVSRYFNQGYHPFFDILLKKRTKTYRLSTTGISEASRLENMSLAHPRVRKSPSVRVSEYQLFTNE